MARRPGAPLHAGPDLPDVELARDFARDAVARRVRGGDWERIGWGIYLPRAPARAAEDTAAAAVRRRVALAHAIGVHRRLSTDHWFSHETAALIWGLPTLDPPSSTHLIQRHSAGARSDPQVVHHVAAVGSADVIVHRGLPVTSLDRTVLDCARTLAPAAGLVVADAALAAGVVREELLGRLEGVRGRPGARRARAVIDLADPGAESAGESFMRFVLLRDGLPRPSTQVRVVTRTATYWADAGWEEWRTLLEYDGGGKYTDRAALVREKHRHDAIVEAGYRVLRVSKEDLRGTRLTARVLAALPASRRPQLHPRRDLRT
ncbi:hypothetical protein [Cellulomonas alba]|uniref:DUF559 domain-containing protein n=1 Tax=Cellulomonas alba TaxID=3053467 RepID=A0ABT7SFB9_9CELL|nr:hypothetical protein [Cellulomonas alba]MDM7854868.1 hypothetical protein [Cellulomonas alba]